VKIGKPVRILSQVDSTNEEIRRNLNKNTPEGLVVIADQQTHGKGRLGRSWHSEPGTGLYLSALLRPVMSIENLACITLMAGLATASAIRQQISTWVKLKWPNDILLNGKKIAGILCECITDSGKNPAVITGIGINLSHTHFPESIKDTATSLKLETGKNVSREDIALSLLQNLDSEYENFLQGKIESLIQRWTQQTDMFGNTITVYQKEKIRVGTAMGLDPHGKLILQTPKGEQMLIESGEISFKPD